MSASTIRRRIRAGTLRVEEARRPQGVVWLVHLPAGTAATAESATVATAPVATTATASQPAGDAIAAMIHATLVPIIGPLVAELAAHRQASERQGEPIRDQAERLGRQAAELERAASTIVTLNAALEARMATESTPALAEPPVPRGRSWVPWVLGVLAILLLAFAVGQPTWVR